MKRLIKLGSKGDTIIEVLLSIAVMSMVLSASYGLANRSSQSNRQSQERAEAQKIGEEQLELLRGYISEDTQWNNATDVCFRADDPATTTVDETGQITDQTSDCQGRGPGGRYNVKITAAGDPAAGYVYTIDTNWENTKGGTDQLAFSYKLASTGDIPDSNNPGGNNPPQPPQITVSVKKVPGDNGNKTQPECRNSSLANKSSIVTRVVGGGESFSSTTDANSTSSFPGLQFNSTYTASYTVPAGFQSCGVTSANVAVDYTANKNYPVDFVIRPICTGGIATVPVYGWVNVLVGWNSGYSLGGYIKSYRYSTGGWAVSGGVRTAQLVTMPAGPEGLNGWLLYRWANGNDATGRLYDFYYANYWQTPIYQQQWLQTGTTTQDTRACPS